ncbi:MAG: DUF2271 domain-containing protein [Proteobacteria bacterium]|nr:MAG: DUF2271 domain-containing protein [Pseudomonadota bacterium]
MRKLSQVLISLTLLANCSEAPAPDYQKVTKKLTSGNVEEKTGKPDPITDKKIPEDADSKTGDEVADEDSKTMEPTTPDPKAPDSKDPPSVPDPVVPPVVPGETEVKGHLDISFSVVGPANAGQFRSRGHIRAVWITDSKNTYLRTLDYHASKRAQYLKRYNSFSGSTIDGSSGATDKSLTTPLSAKVSWDLKSKDGKIVAPGSYKIWFEMAEGNIAGSVEQSAADKQSFDTQAGYAYHTLTVIIDGKAGSSMDSKSPVFTAINLLRRLD